MSSDGGGSENPSELLALLNSDNRVTIEQTKALIHENLYTSRDPTLLNALIEFYLETRSVIALQILANLHEGRAHQIFERLNEHLKQSQTRMDTLTLLGHIVRRQPSWLHKMVNTSLFDTLLKQLKSDSDVLILVSGLMIIASLLPLVPASVGGKLDDLFDIFVRVSTFGAFKPGNTPAVHLLHLNVAIYIFFHRLYAMFPNSLLEYLRNKFGGKNLSRSLIFQQVIKPMMEQVRLHPCLVTETAVSEVKKTRWRAKEPHDIVIECEKLSLEPLQHNPEDGGYNKLLPSQQSLLDKSGYDGDSKGVSLSQLKERRMSDSATQTGKSLQFGDSGVESAGTVVSTDELSSAWSPAIVCGLCTPPSSQLSPSASHLDLSKSITLDHSLCSTPAMAHTPGESPTPSLAGDFCSSVVSTKTKKVLSYKNDGGGNDSESTNHEDTLHKDLFLALLQHEETQLSSAPAALSDHQTSTPKFQLTKSAATEVSSDIVENDAVISENREYGPAVESIKDEKILKTVAVSLEDHRRLLMDEPETDCSELDKEHLCNSLICHGVTQLEDDSLSGRYPSSQTLTEMHNERVMDENRTEVVTSCNIDKEFGKANSEYICQTNDELVTESSSVMTDTKYSETLIEDCKDHTTQIENKSNENSFDDAYKLHTEPGITPRTLLILSSWPWKSSHDSSVLDEVGPASKVHCTPSPVDILDTFIKLGAGIHVDEIARIPLVSLPGVDWTHYGGNPPVDEIDILRKQIQLLHQQLLYERHKCEQHALRNRRLISKTFKAVQYKEELLAIKDHLKLQEEKMKELSEALNKESEANSKLKEKASSWDTQQQIQIRNLLNENAMLQYEKQQAEEKLRTREREFETQQLEFHQMKASLFTFENEVKKLKEQLLEKENLNLQVGTMSKELLIMGEINQQQKDLIKKLSVSECCSPETDFELQSVSKELSSVKHTVQKQKAEIDAQASKLSDSEVQLSRRDMEIKELKKFTENVRGTYVAKLKALEDKYTAQKKVNQTLESHILGLQAKLDNEHRKTKRTKETATSQTERQETNSPPCCDSQVESAE